MKKTTFLSLAKHREVKAYGGMEIRPLSLLTLVLIAFRLSALQRSRVTPGERTTCI